MTKHLTDWRSLIDSRSGVLTRLEVIPRDPAWPSHLVVAVSEIADTWRFAPWASDRVSTGTAFGSTEAAVGAAVGEAVERYCGNFVPSELRRATYAELAAYGIETVDPQTLVLYADWQLASSGCPFVPFGRDLPVLWALGERMDDGGPAYVPASLIWVNYFLPPRDAEPRTNFAMFSGIAAGRSRAEAEASALEELIERDATMIWWHSGSPAMGIQLDAELEDLLAGGRDEVIKYRLVQIRNVFEVPVIGALIEDKEHQVLGLGVAARCDPVEAMRKAVAEAVTLRTYSLGLLDPQGVIWQSAAEGVIEGASFKPHRADRLYADSYRDDFKDVTDLGCQSQIYLDPRMRPHLQRILEPKQCTKLTAISGIPAEDDDARRLAYLALLARRGINAFSVDLTTPDVRAAGLHVVRVVAPGLYGNAPAAFQYYGGHRLYEEPLACGWIDRRLGPTDIVIAPVPHT